MVIRPIETVYKGYKFRSRLEARWAVFFDAIGVAYQYEQEGYEIENNTKYLPDFYLPSVNFPFEEHPKPVYFEVKPMGALDEKTVNKFLAFTDNISAAMIVCKGDPWPDTKLLYILGTGHNHHYIDGCRFGVVADGDHIMPIVVLRKMMSEFNFAHEKNLEEYYWEVARGEKVMDAYISARSERF